MKDKTRISFLKIFLLFYATYSASSASGSGVNSGTVSKATEKVGNRKETMIEKIETIIDNIINIKPFENFGIGCGPCCNSDHPYHKARKNLTDNYNIALDLIVDSIYNKYFKEYEVRIQDNFSKTEALAEWDSFFKQNVNVIKNISFYDDFQNKIALVEKLIDIYPHMISNTTKDSNKKVQNCLDSKLTNLENRFYWCYKNIKPETRRQINKLFDEIFKKTYTIDEKLLEKDFIKYKEKIKQEYENFFKAIEIEFESKRESSKIMLSKCYHWIGGSSFASVLFPIIQTLSDAFVNYLEFYKKLEDYKKRCERNYDPNYCSYEEYIRFCYWFHEEGHGVKYNCKNSCNSPSDLNDGELDNDYEKYGKNKPDELYNLLNSFLPKKDQNDKINYKNEKILSENFAMHAKNEIKNALMYNPAELYNLISKFEDLKTLRKSKPENFFYYFH